AGIFSGGPPTGLPGGPRPPGGSPAPSPPPAPKTEPGGKRAGTAAGAPKTAPGAGRVGGPAIGTPPRHRRATPADPRTDTTRAQNHQEHVARPGAERHPNSNFVCRAGDAVRENAVQADAGEQQRQQAEEAGERGQQAFAQDGLFDHSFESLETDADRGIGLGENAPHRRDDLGLGQARPDQKLYTGPLSWVLSCGQEDDRDELLAQLAVLSVFYPTDDLVAGFRVERRLFNPEAAPDGVGAVQEHAGEGFVHNGCIRRVRGVALIEFPSGEEPRAQRLEVIRAHPAAEGVTPLLRVRAVQPDIVTRCAAAERNEVRVSNRFHSRNAADSVEQLKLES